MNTKHLKRLTYKIEVSCENFIVVSTIRPGILLTSVQFVLCVLLLRIKEFPESTYRLCYPKPDLIRITRKYVSKYGETLTLIECVSV